MLGLQCYCQGPETVEALAVLRELGASWGETALLLALAQQGKEPARLREALRLAREQKERWPEAYALVGLTLSALPEASAAKAAVKEFLAVAQQRGVVSAESGSALRRLQGGSSMQDMQGIHERLSVASKSGQKPGILGSLEAFTSDEAPTQV